MNKILIDEATVKLVLEALEADSFEMVEDANGDMIFLKDQAITALREAPAEQPAQQEPFTHYRHYDGGLQDWSDEKTIPLYTTPQPAQRKPLTNEEIESINERLAGSRDLARLFARAIEAAHNIKENT